MEAVKEFAFDKAKYVEKLRTCKMYVENVERDLKLDLSFYKGKLEKAIQELDNEKIKIVLFGSFSDGKSTILSALTENLGIKISPEPTTDSVQVYNYENFCLVDTPGLFSENIPHDELTKKFISEADLIIFTTDAVNPLKESQHEVIRWILKDLGKLDQTVFVINKMDTVADLYSKDDFRKVCDIKKSVVKETLNKILGEERNDYFIICLSADPWGMGISYWLNNKEEYEALSNLRELRNLINNVVQEKRRLLKRKTIEAILKDISIRSSHEFKKKIEELEKEIKRLEIEYENLNEQLNFSWQELRKVVLGIKNRLNSKREELISELYACHEFSCLKEFQDIKIGRDGSVLLSTVGMIISEEMESFYNYIRDTAKILEAISNNLERMENLNSQIMSFGSPVMKKMKNTGKLLKRTSVGVLRDAIIKTRDFLSLPIKFRPWQAVKFAKVLKSLGVAIEALTVFSEVVGTYRFEKKRDELIESIDDFFRSISESIDSQFLKENYLTFILDLEKAEEELASTLEQYRFLLKKYREVLFFFEKCAEELK